MSYTNFWILKDALNKIEEYSAVLTEYGKSVSLDNLKSEIDNTLEKVKSFVENENSPDEPDDYESIIKLCKGGNTVVKNIPDLKEKIAGALLGRFVGCTLGVPVEMWSIENMKKLAKYNNMPFPPIDYWTTVDRPYDIQYSTDERIKYTRDNIDGVPVDDDVTYTILGLLIIEKYGFNFTTEDVGNLWKEILPIACTAEDIALKNLKKGIPANKAGSIDNPYRLWIGADIRADGFAYCAAGNPTLAAAMGYRDAYLSHRRGGIYGEMFFAAAEAAAFVCKNPIEAIYAGIREIPTTSKLYKDIEWALNMMPSIKNYEQAREAVDNYFNGMSPVHTNNNACLTIFGLKLGNGDFTDTIGNTVAMGLDNDCTGATAGSIIGAIVGEKGISSHWTKNFNNKVRTYLIGHKELSIDDLINRFVIQAKKL